MTFKFDPPVGTGPYRLVSATEMEVTLERRDDWWGTIVTQMENVDFLPMSSAIADMWTKEGIPTTVKNLAWATLYPLLQTGDFDFSFMWCHPGDSDPLDVFNVYNGKYVKPLGVPTGFVENYGRCNNSKYDALLEQLRATSPDDLEACIEIVRELYRIYCEDVIQISVVQAIIATTFNHYYWTNWPTKENAWMSSTIWWPNLPYMITGFQSPLHAGEWSGGIKPMEIKDTMVYFTKDTPKFRGIDSVWYGPFEEEDAARIPVDDAEYWIRQGYASYTAPAPTIPTIPTEIIEATAKDVSAIKGDVSTLKGDVASLSGQVSAVVGQIGTMTAAAAIEGIAIIVLAIALVVSLRKRT